MNSGELNSLVRELKISKDRILQEEAEITFLDKLAKSPLGAKVLFYGGTALRLTYDSPRFSEDIDLLCIKKIQFSEFKKFINSIVEKDDNWKLKDLKNKRQTIFALILIKHKKLKHDFSLKIEFHKPGKKIKIKNELRLIKSPTSILSPLLLVPTLQEMKKIKTEALIKRKKARDVFDLWYISQLLREGFVLPKKSIKHSKQEFKNELQVFLPKKYYPTIQQLYEQIDTKN